MMTAQLIFHQTAALRLTDGSRPANFIILIITSSEFASPWIIGIVRVIKNLSKCYIYSKR